MGDQEFCTRLRKLRDLWVDELDRATRTLAYDTVANLMTSVKMATEILDAKPHRADVTGEQRPAA